MTEPNVISIWGPEGTWKTSVALSWVDLGKLVHYEFDIGGFARASWRFKPEQLALITSKRFATPVQLEKLKGTTSVTSRLPKKLIGVKELWQSFVIDFVATVQSDITSIVFDSATKLWNIVTRSYLQELQEKQLASGKFNEDTIRERLTQIEYGEPNDRMATLIYTARQYEKNLILIHYPRDKYRDFVNSKGEKESVTTGELEPDGFKETRKLIDLELHTEWGKDRNGTDTIQLRIVNKCALIGVGTRGLGLYLPTPDYKGMETLVKGLEGV